MTVTILMGLPGSGKSTLAKQLEGFRTKVINQDNLGNRTRCFEEAEKWLGLGISLVIDRTNVSYKQRLYWVQLAKHYKADVKCIFLCDNVDVCISRIVTRLNHPTLKHLTLDRAQSIVLRASEELEFPSLEEGFSEIVLRRS